MSFSAEVKSELCRVRLPRDCCIQAQALGVLLFGNLFAPDGVRIVTESKAFSLLLPQLFRRAFQMDFDQFPPEGAGEKRKFVFQISQPEKLAFLWERCGYETAGGYAHHINFAALEEEHCRLSFLRGAFLAGGSVTDPQKGYHLELVTSHYNVSRELGLLLRESERTPKETVRKSHYVLYFKQSETIEDLLTAMGAPIAAMEMMNAKLEKNLRNGVNRRVNCDDANAGKIAVAATDQLAAIRLLAQRGGLKGLSDKLRETAELRLQNPSLSLTQLAELSNPPVSKSCLNHRLRKLMTLARAAEISKLSKLEREDDSP